MLSLHKLFLYTAVILNQVPAVPSHQPIVLLKIMRKIKVKY